MTYLRSSLITLATVVALAQPLSATCVAPTGVDSAPAINQALINAGVGGTVYLCPSTIYNVKSSVRFAHVNQTLLTETFDTGNTDLSQRAWIWVNSASVTVAVSAVDMPGSWLKWVQVEGGRNRFGLGSGPMLYFGGSVTTSSTGRTQEVRNCFLTEPRGWTAIVVAAGTGGCTNVVVANNDIGPAGHDDGTWADGISYQCRNGFVTGNYIYDATDGGIVVFGAPGSLIGDNTILAVTRDMLGGINLVDSGPFQTPTGDGDYRGTRVYHNWIEAYGGFIHVGIGSGPNIWWSQCGDTLRNDGATVDYNTITGLYMGYGNAVDGVRNWTVTNNTDTATHVHDFRGTFCKGQIAIPRKFQKYGARSSGTFTGNSSTFLEAVLDQAADIVY
jgi:hypothetical protein